MRTNIFIESDGTVLNPSQNNLIADSPINETAASSLFNNQITITCYTNFILQSNGIYVPDRTTKVINGLSGTIQIKAYPSADAPYSVDLDPTDTIDISDSCILQWFGI